MKRQVARIPDADFVALHHGFGLVHLEQPQLDEAAVAARANALGQYHQGRESEEEDCRIVAEAELGGRARAPYVRRAATEAPSTASAAPDTDTLRLLDRPCDSSKRNTNQVPRQVPPALRRALVALRGECAKGYDTGRAASPARTAHSA